MGDVLMRNFAARHMLVCRGTGFDSAIKLELRGKLALDWWRNQSSS